jgi:hypothetical protein
MIDLINEIAEACTATRSAVEANRDVCTPSLFKHSRLFNNVLPIATIFLAHLTKPYFWAKDLRKRNSICT